MLGILNGKAVKVTCIDVKSSHLLRACFNNTVMTVSNCNRRQNKQNHVHYNRQSEVIIIEDLVKSYNTLHNITYMSIPLADTDSYIFENKSHIKVVKTIVETINT